jgi:hypothetical protein
MSDPSPFATSRPSRRQTRRSTAAQRRRQITRRHTLAVLVVSGGLVVGTGAALAVFSTTATTTASVALPDPSISVTAGTVTASGLYPGFSVPAEVVVVNDGPADYTVTGVGGSATASPTACPGDDVAVLTPTPLPTLAPSATATLTVGIAMATDASTECQNAAFEVAVTVDGRIG